MSTHPDNDGMETLPSQLHACSLHIAASTPPIHTRPNPQPHSKQPPPTMAGTKPAASRTHCRQQPATISNCQHHQSKLPPSSLPPTYVPLPLKMHASSFNPYLLPTQNKPPTIIPRGNSTVIKYTSPHGTDCHHRPQLVANLMYHTQTGILQVVQIHVCMPIGSSL